MSNIAKIRVAVAECEQRGYPAKNLLLSKMAAAVLVRELAGRDVDVTPSTVCALSTVCGLVIFVTDTLPDRVGVLRHYRNMSNQHMYQFAEPCNTVEFDL